MTKGQVITVPMIPIRDVVVFPHTMFPFIIGRESSVKALDAAISGERHLFLAAQKDPTVDDPSQNDIYPVGTVTLLVQNLKLPEGNIKVLVEGLQTGRILNCTRKDGYYLVSVELLQAPETTSVHDDSLRQQLSEIFEEYVKHNPSFNIDSISRFLKGNDLAKIADNTASLIPVPVKEKQELLEITSPVARIERIISLISFEIEKLKLEKTIQNRVREQMEKAQKDYYLHEKIKAIQKELGEDDRVTEYEELRAQIEASGMTNDARDKALKEVSRMEMMPAMSAESAVCRNYVDWLLSLPWKKVSHEARNLHRAEKILEEDHYGLEKIKERILEFLAVRLLVRNSKGTILCFVGPPGVGKTSLGRSIARASNREFVRLSLGGIRDEAEIRGHRRTYIGAFPGQIIQLLKKAGTRNPVFLLDEVDKMSMDFRGDPSSALLEVLDPEQNSHFVDHFIDTEFNLAQVMFIATANVLHNIPRPLQDRMEVIELTGYTELEKIEIAKRYLLPKQLKENGLEKFKVQFQDTAFRKIIGSYTRESGVRNLEREIGKISRKITRRKLMDKSFREESIEEGNIGQYLGPIRFRKTTSNPIKEVGVAQGMAWTEVGGEVLITESIWVPGTGKLTLTGKLGEVMQESAQAALSYVRSRAALHGISEDFFKQADIHVHLPEGAIPKDGPSAGITMATAIFSTVTGFPVMNDLSMTGEITLRGNVLPIGGVKEKVLAAHRAGIRRIILPEDNRKDLEDIPKEVAGELTFHFVSHMDQVLQLALDRVPSAQQSDEACPGIDTGRKEGRIAN